MIEKLLMFKRYKVRKSKSNDNCRRMFSGEREISQGLKLVEVFSSVATKDPNSIERT